MKGRWNKSSEVKFKRFLQRAYMPKDVLDHIGIEIERLIELTYGGYPQNLRYDPYNRVYWFDIIKYTADPAPLTEKDGIFTTERNSL